MAPPIGFIAHLGFNVGCVCLSVGLLGLGVACMFAPEAAAQLYGIPADATGAWVQVAGLRDLGLGCTALALYCAQPSAMRVFAPTLLVIPVGDAALTFRYGSAFDALTHLVGTVAIAVLAACAWLDPALKPKLE